MRYITDEIRRARVIGGWEQRYREGTLPDADNHAAEFIPTKVFGPAQPGTVADIVERFVRSHKWRNT